MFLLKLKGFKVIFKRLMLRVSFLNENPRYILPVSIDMEKRGKYKVVENSKYILSLIFQKSLNYTSTNRLVKKPNVRWGLEFVT